MARDKLVIVLVQTRVRSNGPKANRMGCEWVEKPMKAATPKTFVHTKGRRNKRSLGPRKAKGIRAVSWAVMLVLTPFLLGELPLRINVTPSLPRGLYHVYDCAPKIGDIVVHSIDPYTLSYAIERGYYSPASRGFLKGVAALEEDELCWSDGALLINNVYAGAVSPHDSKARPLPQRFGCEVIQQGDFLPLVEGSQSSFDGRYYGPISLSFIKSCARKLL